MFGRGRIGALVVGAFAIAAMVACSDKDDAEPSRTPEATRSTSVTATASVAAQPSPTVTPTPASTPAGLYVKWMTLDSGASGAVVVRLETNVPSTAILRVVGAPGMDAPKPPEQTSTTPALRHTISIPTFQQDWIYEVEVSGTGIVAETATGALEAGAIVGNQYWTKGANAPKVEFDGLDGVATWTNLKAAPGPILGGEVVILAKRAGCAPAEQCAGEPAVIADEDTTGGDAVAETHEIEFTLPDSEHDYQVVMVGRPGTDAARFYQVDVLAGDTD